MPGAALVRVGTRWSTRENPDHGWRAVLPPSPFCTILSSQGLHTEGERGGQGQKAQAEFQKIIDHRGLANNALPGALAHLQLARAYVLSGDMPKAHTSFQDLLRLWKDADPDRPTLKEAKAEYAKLN